MKNVEVLFSCTLQDSKNSIICGAGSWLDKVVAVGCVCDCWGFRKYRGFGEASYPHSEKTQNSQPRDQHTWSICWLGISAEFCGKVVKLGHCCGSDCRMWIQLSRLWQDGDVTIPLSLA